METAREGEMLVKGTVGTGEGGIVCKNTLETQQESWRSSDRESVW